MIRSINQGINNPRAKLDYTKVVAIRNSSLSTRALARQYGVSQATIQRVKTGENWR